jgi:hypothetical protein
MAVRANEGYLQGKADQSMSGPEAAGCVHPLGQRPVRVRLCLSGGRWCRADMASILCDSCQASSALYPPKDAASLTCLSPNLLTLSNRRQSRLELKQMPMFASAPEPDESPGARLSMMVLPDTDLDSGRLI